MADKVFPGSSRILNPTSAPVAERTPSMSSSGDSGSSTGNSGPFGSHPPRIVEEAGDGSIISASSYSDTLRSRGPDDGVEVAARSDVGLGTFNSSSHPFPTPAPSPPPPSGRSPSHECAGHVGFLPQSNTASQLEDNNPDIVVPAERQPLRSRSPSTDCPSPSHNSDIDKDNAEDLLPTTNLGSSSPPTPISKSPSTLRLGSNSDNEDIGHIPEQSPSPGHDDNADETVDIRNPRINPRVVIRLPLKPKSKRSSDGAVSQPKRLKLSEAKSKRKRIPVKYVPENDEDDDMTTDEDDAEKAADSGDDNDMEVDQDAADKAGDSEDDDGMVIDNEDADKEDAVSIPRLTVEGDKEVNHTMKGG